jgi:hypothetical protein
MLFVRNKCAGSGQFSGFRFASLFFVTILGAMCSPSASASNVTVASPVNRTRVPASVWVRAHNVGCDGLRPQAFGYSVDNSSTITWGVTPYDIDVTKVSITAGTHTIHFKSWTTHGLCPVMNTTFAVVNPGGSNGSGATSGSSGGTGSASVPAPAPDLIPSNAVASANLDGANNWAYEWDPATPGSARGSTVYPATTPSYDDAREFYMTYSARGGERWHISFAKDANATHFVYDTYVYIVDPSQIANIEMDMNQVMSDGRTVIFGTQCSSYSKTWEYTIVSGGTHWKSSNIACNPMNWAAKTWHHIQIASHRNNNGDVTYDWVNVDETHSEFTNATGNSAEALGWAQGDLLINFQLDGSDKDSGAITAYVHKLTILRW